MSQEPLELRSLLSIIRRRRKLIYYSFCMAMLLAVIVNLMPPTYEAKVTIRVKPVSRGLSDSSGLSWGSEELARQKMYTYAELIKSRTVVETAIKKMDAAKNETVTVDAVTAKITVRPLKDTEILNVLVQAESPKEAQTIVNAVAVAFNERLMDIVRAESKDARVFIGERLIDVKRELEKTEKALVDYKGSNQLVSISEQTRNFVDRQSNLKRLEAENKLALEAARAKMKAPSIIADTPVIQALRSRLAEQETEMAGLLKNYTDQHPRVKTLQASIVENRTKLQVELARLAKGELSLSETQRAALLRISQEEEREMAKLPAKERGLARLMRDYTVAEELYTMLAKRYEEARISEIMEPTNVQIVDMASLPEAPVKPRKNLNLMIATVIGLFTGTMIAFVAEYFFKTIDTAEDVRLYLDLQVIGSIPRVEGKSRWSLLKAKVGGARSNG